MNNPVVTYVQSLMDVLNEAVNWEYVGFLDADEKAKRFEQAIREVLDTWNKERGTLDNLN